MNRYISDCDALLNGRCYMAYEERLTWHRAKDFCIESNGSLAVVCDEETSHVLQGIMQLTGR